MIFSDDAGQTWTTGGTVTVAKHDLLPSESSALELVDGSIYLNSRRHSESMSGRAFAISDDGGESFTTAGEDKQLPDPMIQGSTLRYSASDEGAEASRILFSNSAHPTLRRQMTVRSSFDEGKTWNRGRMIDGGHTAYSDLLRTESGIGLLYERGQDSPYEQIMFASFNTAWLDEDTG